MTIKFLPLRPPHRARREGGGPRNAEYLTKVGLSPLCLIPDWPPTRSDSLLGRWSRSIDHIKRNIAKPLVSHMLSPVGFLWPNSALPIPLSSSCKSWQISFFFFEVHASIMPEWAMCLRVCTRTHIGRLYQVEQTMGEEGGVPALHYCTCSNGPYFFMQAATALRLWLPFHTLFVQYSHINQVL